MTKLLVFLAAVAIVAQSQTGGLGAGVQEILNIDAMYREAVLRADVETLKSILKEDLIIVHSDGDRDTRANFLNAISSGRLKMQSYQRSKISVRIFGSTALLLSETRKRFTYKGKPGKDDDTSLVTYVREGARWRMAAMQNTHRSN